MASALIISSYVVASRVGGFIQALAFNALGIEARLLPTVLLGRHPGLGAPGGGAVGPDTFKGMLEGAQAQGVLHTDLILTGYFALPEQVEMAAAAIDSARSGGRRPLVLVDPILGDEPLGLYVKPEVETAVRALLIPRADLLAPNIWELRRITGQPAKDAAGVAAAARTLGKPALVSSTPCGADQIGVLYVDGALAWLAGHLKVLEAPKGTGDLLTALFASGLIEGLPAQTALARAVGGLADAITAAVAGGLEDLPTTGLAAAFQAPASPVTLTALG
jgi:pyridoxine kinase